MGSFEELSKELGHIEICAYPFFYQRAEFIIHEKFKAEIDKEIRDFGKENHLKLETLETIEPEGRGGGGEASFAAFIFSLWENKDLIIFLISVLRYVSRKFLLFTKSKLKGYGGAHSYDQKPPMIRLEATLRLHSEFEDFDINLMNILDTLASTVIFMDSLRKKIKDKHPLFDVEIVMVLTNIPQSASVRYVLYKNYSFKALAALQANIRKAVLAPQLSTTFEIKPFRIIKRSDDYRHDYRGIHPGFCNYYIFLHHRDRLIKDYVKSFIISWREEKRISGETYKYDQ